MLRRRPASIVGALAVVLASSCSSDKDSAGAPTTFADVPTTAATTEPAATATLPDEPTTAVAGATGVETAVPGTAPSAGTAIGPVPTAGPGCPMTAAELAGVADLTMADAVAALPALTALADAIDATDLAERLGGPGPFTLFAPSDAAFAAAGDAPGNGDDLNARLSLHLLPDAASTIANLVGPEPVTTDSGDELVVAAAPDGTATVDAGGGPGTVVCADIPVANGVLHVIDTFLVAPTDDTLAVGGSELFTVDAATGAATTVGGFGAEIGVLGLTATDDGRLLTITDAGELRVVDPADPVTAVSSTPITGIEGATLLAVDVAPDGRVLALSDAAVLFSLDPATGAATPIGTGLDPAPEEPGLGFDVDPASGAVRVAEASGTNLRVDPDTGDVLAVDPVPAYAATDVSTGGTPRLVAAAYPASGDPFVVDAATATLARLAPDGALTTVGPLGVTITDGASLDVAPDGTMYLAVPG